MNDADADFDSVGPVLSSCSLADVLIDALRRRNVGLRVRHQGAYVRALVPGRCTLLRADVEELLGRPFEFPRDLEGVMPSFKGKLALTRDGAEWST